MGSKVAGIAPRVQFALDTASSNGCRSVNPTQLRFCLTEYPTEKKKELDQLTLKELLDALTPQYEKNTESGFGQVKCEIAALMISTIMDSRLAQQPDERFDESTCNTVLDSVSITFICSFYL